MTTAIPFAMNPFRATAAPRTAPASLWRLATGLGGAKRASPAFPSESLVLSSARMNSGAFDLLILGGGSAAFAAAEEAMSLGARVALVEHGTLGGTCLNRGCVPSKYLIHAAEIFHDAAFSSHPRSPHWGALVAAKNRRIREARLSKDDFILRHRRTLTYVQGHGRFLSSDRMEVGGRILTAPKALIATGSRPAIPTLPGLENVRFLTSDTAFDLKKLPRSILILGAGPLGLELAQMLSRLGVKVTLVSTGSRLLPEEEPEVHTAVAELLASEKITLRLGHRAAFVEQRKGAVHIQLQGPNQRTSVVQAEALLLAVGRQANTNDCGLENTRVHLDIRGSVSVYSGMQTRDPQLWAAGDCVSCGCPNLYVYVAKRQGAVAAHNALRPSDAWRMDYRVVPRAIFMSPEMASVGESERSARRRGIATISRVIPLTSIPRAWIQGKARGFVKIIAEASSRRLLGATLVMPRAGEVIHEAAFALRTRAEIDDLIDLLHVYPTYSEALSIAAKAFPAS